MTLNNRNHHESLVHRRRLWGQHGHAPPIIKRGQNPFLCPPLIRLEFFIFFYLKKHESKQKQRQRKKGSKF